jgi:hypothetical protein
MPPSHPIALCAAALAVSACASDPAPRTQVLVKLTRPSADAAAIERQAAATARTPVTYVSATSDRWHALALGCGSAADCDAAVARLRADHADYESVEIDQRRRSMAP